MKRLLVFVMSITLIFPSFCFGQEVSDSVLWNQIFSESESVLWNQIFSEQAIKAGFTISSEISAEKKGYQFWMSRKQFIEDSKNDPLTLSIHLNQIAVQDYNTLKDVEKSTLLYSKAILILEKAELNNDGYTGKYGTLSSLYCNRASTLNNQHLTDNNVEVWNKVIEDFTKSIEYFKFTKKFKEIGFNKKKWNIFYHTKIFAQSYNFRGNAYLKIGDSDKAMDDFDKAAILYPKYYLRCEVFRNGCNNNNYKACEYYNKHCK